MLGAIIGDLVGSIYEHHNIKSKEFPFFSRHGRPTDDSLMTIAIAEAILECYGNMELLHDQAIRCMQKIGRQYPNCGWGKRFSGWVKASFPYPYNSSGNGSAMRVSAVGWAAKDLDECIAMSKAVTEVSHNHPEGIKGAEAIAVAVFMAVHGASKDEIRTRISNHYYPLNFTLDDIRDDYTFDVSCQGSVPQAIEAFLESESFEDAIRNAISIGGDSDTIAACTGAIAEAFYGVTEETRSKAIKYFRFGWENRYPQAYYNQDPDLLAVVDAFEKVYGIGVK